MSRLNSGFWFQVPLEGLVLWIEVSGNTETVRVMRQMLLYLHVRTFANHPQFIGFDLLQNDMERTYKLLNLITTILWYSQNRSK